MKRERHNRLRVLGLTLWPLLCSMQGTEWFVDANFPGCPRSGGNGSARNPFCTIQAAVDNAAEGDVIRVAPGDYYESVMIDRSVSLIGAGPSRTVIHGVGDSALRILECSARVEGLTLTGGIGHALSSSGGPFPSLYRAGGGLLAMSSTFGSFDVSVVRCLITKNQATNGGGVYNFGPNLELVDSIIRENTAVQPTNSVWCPSGAGGGVYSSDSRLTVKRCSIIQNVAHEVGSGLTAMYGSAKLANTVVADNRTNGGYYSYAPSGIYADNLLATNCTIANNDGYGILGEGSMVIMNSIAWNNEYEWTGCGYFRVEYSLSDSSCPGPGNIVGDPGFLEPETGDYRLGSGSPAIDAGNSRLPSGLLDVGGRPRFVDDLLTPNTGIPHGRQRVVDIGAYEHSPLYRRP